LPATTADQPLQCRLSSIAGVNPVGKHSQREAGCQASRRQVASLGRRIFTGTKLRSRIMLRMMLLGLLIPLGVGVLSAMELRAPSRSEVAVVQPIAETPAGTSDSRGALAKADRLEIAAASSKPPVQPALVNATISPLEDIRIAPSEPPRPINRHMRAPKSKKAATAARPKPKSKPAHSKPANSKAANTRAADITRTAVAGRAKAARDTQPCRLRAFGGLLKALNSTDCEI
jgi:hypothetical protein